ncbi:MAG: UDP-N-acetylmuramoyl-tripeptide--D-alanyl-D-alanine ligase [Clostridia bacterium]|nr:UDP-N-acetylmuramoyl-tripeptide--D-alanyl-D-alanine ligase [Clostridia bacterium]
MLPEIMRICLILSSTALTLMAAKYYVHMLQLEGYFISQFLHHLFARIRNPKLLFKPAKTKKPLVYTQRIIRLYVCLGILTLAYEICVCALFASALTKALGFPASLLAVLPILLVSLFVLLAALITKPVEKLISLWFVSDAKKILQERDDLTIVGITGSYGKTSTKFILSTILSEKYSVLTPPASYNTTLGVVRVIREQLQPDHEIFICEMGSRHIGDIKEICDFVHPHHALITSIGPQHLDTFLSIEGVKKGKFELIEAIDKEKGCAVFASSNEHISELYEKAQCKKLSAGFLEKDDLRAEDISVGCAGSVFTLVLPNGDKAECVTKLLGAHNISNILVASAMAYALGLSAQEIARGISKIQPVEHRLQIVNQSPVTVIDDAFNSSPNGANAALDVLGRFVGRRIIVTPGFVELGADQDKYHFELGKKIKDNADVAILVGKKRTEKIKEGLEGFAGEIFVVDTLSDATQKLTEITFAGDVVLFENDLPDNYNE